MSRIQKYFEKYSPANCIPSAVAYLAALDHLENEAPDIAAAITNELTAQRTKLKLIASENYSSLAVQLAMGNLLTDKYAEGYARHRFYAGCENVDTVEDAATRELESLFGCDHAYVQPHSGADANLVAFWSILFQRVQSKEMEKLGKKKVDELTDEEHERIRQLMMNQKVLGMSLNSGGHLTHGYRLNASSKMMRASHYDVDPKTERLDYSALAAQAKEEKPDILLTGYSAHPCRLNFAKLREIADSVGAVLMVDMAHFAGLVAGKVFTGEENPVPYAHFVTSTTHKTLRGPRGGIVMCTDEYAEMVNKGCPLVLGGPLPHVMAAKAIAFREASTPEFQQYANQVVNNAKRLAEELVKRNVRVITGGTENHMVIFDVSSFGLTGKHAEQAFGNAQLTVNRNAIPFDKNGPWFTSGVRVGTPAITTLGMGPDEMTEIADVIVNVLKGTKPAMMDSGKPSKGKSETESAITEKSIDRVKNLLLKFPLYPEIEIDQMYAFNESLNRTC